MIRPSLMSSQGVYEKASIRRRTAYSAVLATLGLGISTGFALVSKRHVLLMIVLTDRVIKRIDVLPGGKSVDLHTGFFRLNTTNKGIEVPINQLSLRRTMFTGNGPNQAISSAGTFTQLLRQDQLIGYLVDRRGQFMVSPRVLDELFVKK